MVRAVCERLCSVGVYDGVELDDLVLSGPRLTLRRWQMGDAARVYDILQDPSMHRFLNLPNPYSPEMAGEFVVKNGHEGRREGSGFGSAVVRSDTGELVGSAALRLPFGLRKTAEIGYWVAPTAQGNGYAAEAAAILADWAFAHGVTRIEVLCQPENVASAATALRAGFQYEGLRRKSWQLRGQAVDEAAFARLASDSGDPVAWAFPPVREPISDGVIRLRPFDPERDSAPNLELESDAVTLAVSFNGWLDEAQLVSKQKRWPLDWLVGSIAQFSIVDEATGGFAGTIQLRKVGPPRLASVGYAVHPAFRGNGYTTRALRLLSEWAFANGFARLELGVKWHNTASRKAAAAAGFTEEALLAGRLGNPDGSYSDEAYYGLSNPAATRSRPPR